MSDTPRVPKDLADDWTYTIDVGLYAAELLEADPLASCAFATCTPTGLTVGSPVIVDGYSAKVRMSGGTAGTSYLVRGTWTTASGQIGGWKVWVDLDPE